jgi:hypothetical protein
VGKVRLLWHRAFQPSKTSPIDFERDIAQTLRELRGRYYVRSILFDPYQLESLSQQLIREGLPMERYDQTVPALTVLANNLYQLVRSRGLVVYPADDLRAAVLATAVTESERGFKLSKMKQSRKIDLTVALSMAALGAARQVGLGSDYTVTDWDGTPYERHPDIPNWDLGFCDRDGNLLPEVEAAKAARLRGPVP